MTEWRCFHCDEVFTDRSQAELHFGISVYTEAQCQITPRELRELQQELARYREEDTDLHRQIQRMHSEHATALRRAEEKGYARGLADADKEGYFERKERLLKNNIDS